MSEHGDQERKMKIGFIGLGNMGAPMAQRLAEAGHKIIGYDLASKVALNAYTKDISLKESCLELTDLSESDFDKFTNPKNMV